MTDTTLEQIIEFPIKQGEIFTEQPLLPQAYGLCYQYDVDQHGYGPYGFNTTSASNFLRTLFPNFLRWEPERKILENTIEPTQEGIYFSKIQPHTSILEVELEHHKKNVKIYLLREKYEKNDTLTAQRTKSALVESTKHKKISAEVISTFITHKQFFLINHFFMSDARSTLIFLIEKSKQPQKKSQKT
ncbi:hypothetical protein [Pseudomonas sp. NPDC088444]|uniref:hypothetical protein n=1 Tax=Pseudomonas sp. NPDC088444 TaxID=3364456 RepID=UPI00384C3ADD